MLGLASAATASMAKSTPEHRNAIVGLMTPYCAWVSAATALNYRIWCVWVLEQGEWILFIKCCIKLCRLDLIKGANVEV